MGQKRVILVEWIDSRRPTSDWEFLNNEDLPEIVKCLSVGFLLKEDQAQIILASNLGDIDNNEQVMGMMAIPTCSIIKRIDLGN